MWLMLQNTGEGALNEDHLDCVLIKCSVRSFSLRITDNNIQCTPGILNSLSLQEGKVFISKIAGFLLCIRAKDSVGFGLLKKKSQLLKEYCQQPLKEVKHSWSEHIWAPGVFIGVTYMSFLRKKLMSLCLLLWLLSRSICVNHFMWYCARNSSACDYPLVFMTPMKNAKSIESSTKLPGYK